MERKFYPMREGIHYTGLMDMIKWINEIHPTSEMRMIEIGSYIGESTTIFADNFKEVISVDPYVDGYDKSDISTADVYAPFNEVYTEFLRNTIHYPNIKSIRETSENALKVLREEKWDLVYIDGAHTLEGVHFDILHYKDVIKEGGFLCGHDYGWGNIRHNIGLLLDDKVDATFIDGSWIRKL